MKKFYVASCIAIFISATAFAQKEDSKSNSNITTANFNEFKLNGLFLILGGLEVTYERTISEESAVGISAFIPIDDDIDDINYFIAPYFRFYFGRKYAAGFFVEGFGMVNSTDSVVLGNSTTPRFITKENTDFALGIGTGAKWITNSGFIAELSFGVGRNLFNNNNQDFEIIGKGGINLGYRF